SRTVAAQPGTHSPEKSLQRRLDCWSRGLTIVGTAALVAEPRGAFANCNGIVPRRLGARSSGKRCGPWPAGGDDRRSRGGAWLASQGRSRGSVLEGYPNGSRPSRCAFDTCPPARSALG